MWYSASLFFQNVKNDNPTDSDLWEQQVFLIQADSEVDAKIQAERIGKSQDHEYNSATGDRIHCVFRYVEAIFQLFDAQPKSGTEVYSRFLRADEVRSLLKPFDDREEMGRS